MYENNAALGGVLPVLPSIFDSRGAVDEAGMKRVLDYIISSGADGVVFPGLASEYEQLTPEERDYLVKQVGAWCAGRCKFVVGASGPSAEMSARYAIAGAQAGAQDAMIMTPRDVGDDVDAMVKFYQDVGERSGISIMLQNAPRPMGVGLSIKGVAEIAARVPAITSVKEETPPCGQRVTQLITQAGTTISGVFGGGGGRQIIDEMVRGSAGTVPACEITEIHVQMVRAFRDKQESLARDLFERSLPLLMVQAVFRWRLTKAVLKMRGLIDSEYTRAPGPELDTLDRAEINKLLVRIEDLTGLNVQEAA